MAAHGNQVVMFHINPLLSSTGLESGMCTFHGFTAGQQGWQLPSVVCAVQHECSQQFPLPLVGDYRFASSIWCLFENNNFFFLFENHSVFWAVTLQHSTAEQLRWEWPYEDHLVLLPAVFSFKAQCRCSKSTEKWGCKTVMIPAYLTSHPVFPVRYSLLIFLGPILCQYDQQSHPFTVYYSVHTLLPSISIFIHAVFQEYSWSFTSTGFENQG